MKSRREFMRAGVSPFSGELATWSPVSGSTSDYIVEEARTGTRVRFSEAVVNCGFFVGGSFHDSEANLSVPETEEALALFVSKALQHNLDGIVDLWLVNHSQLERTRSRAFAGTSQWAPVSVLELYRESEHLGNAEIALQTLRTFSLLGGLATPQRVMCRTIDGHVSLELRPNGRIFPSGLIYGVSSIHRANRELTGLVREGLLLASEGSGGKCEITISSKGHAVCSESVPVDFKLQSFVKEIEDSKHHPLPEMGLVVPDPVLAAALSRRWKEADACHRGGSYLATTVLIASILEGCLLARLRFALASEHTFVKTPDHKAAASPEDWGLGNLLAVCANEGWIRKDRHSLGHVLKDARNLVHPARLVDSQSEADERSARTYWEIVQGVIEDLSKSYT